MSTNDDRDVRDAQQILWGQRADVQEMVQLSARLAQMRRFDYARRITGLLRSDERLTDPRLIERTAIRFAFYHLKDETLPVKYRLGRALQILNSGFDLAKTTNQEVTGLAGAIYKRMWEADGQMSHLYRAVGYYRRGMESSVEADQGYNAINFAFLLDVLAAQEAEEAKAAGTVSAVAEERRHEAAEIRREVVERLPPLLEDPTFDWLGRQFWFYATVAEAYFGLGQYDEAEEWLLKAKEQAVTDEGIQINARQLAIIARLNGAANEQPDASGEPPALRAIGRFVGDKVTGEDFAGKIGLGLSGGGFRASLFHIGVLAKLAELDVLRRVEVLSCVSGGSIIGAHYYLEVRKLLQSKTDAEITREDYIDVVERVAEEFVAGVRRNLRTRVFSELTTCLKMVFVPGYSAALRLGELFESELFARVSDGGGSERWLDELRVMPAGEAPHFIPEQSNWRRDAKVPELIINATSLNTGHNWQFTADGMGESAWSVRAENNEGTLYRFTRYPEGGEGRRRFRLGHAVAASACVPGLFGPVTLRGTYGDGTVVRLVDGGVYDNQGIVGLLDRGCSWFLISDASGQFLRTKSPSGGLLGGAMRSTEIQSRIVRDTLFEGLGARGGLPLSGGRMFIDLRKDLDDLDETAAAPAAGGVPLTAYGVPKEVQARLSTVRTDLDSFSDVEAYALMASGYRMTEFESRRGNVPRVSDAPAERRAWRFLEIERAFTPPEKSNPLYSRLLRLLKISGLRLGKTFRLLLLLRLFLGATLLASAGMLFYMLWTLRDSAVFVWTGSTVIYVLLFAALCAILARLLGRSVSWDQIGIGLFFSAFGFVFAKLHLFTFDRLYLKFGALERLIPSRAADATPPPPPPHGEA